MRLQIKLQEYIDRLCVKNALCD